MLKQVLHDHTFLIDILNYYEGNVFGFSHQAPFCFVLFFFFFLPVVMTSVHIHE